MAESVTVSSMDLDRSTTAAPCSLKFPSKRPVDQIKINLNYSHKDIG